MTNGRSAAPAWARSLPLFVPEDLVEAGFVPVVNGAGKAFYDNLRVTAFEGTDFAAEATRVRRAIKIDGKLDDWAGKCPIPLIGKINAALTAATTPGRPRT